MSVTTTLEPISNYQGTDGYTPLVPSVTQTDHRVSPTTTNSRESSSATTSPVNDGLQGMVDSQQFTSGSTIGLAIGLPVGIFCLGLVLFLGISGMRKRLTINHRKSIDSSRTTNTTQDRNWFSKMIYGSDGQCGERYDFEKSLPFADSSTIQYKVTKSKPQHILTPKASRPRDDVTSLEEMSIEDDVDVLLYSKPPDIYHIESEMPSSNNLPGNKMATLTSTDKRPKPPALGLPHKWNYDSPLSSWFLRNSTYLANDDEANLSNDQIATNADSILTPTVQLKQLKILSRVNKHYADGSQLMENEKSPFLEKSISYLQEGEQAEENSLESNNSNVGQAVVSYGTVTPKTEDKNPFIYQNCNQNCSKDGRKSRSESWLGYRLRKPDDKRHSSFSLGKKVECDASQKFHVGNVYKVVEDYDSVLADEINIRTGEFVLILATHTDGWCLVEKCTENGTSKNSQITVDAGDKRYLNNDRGIIPGDCLDDIRPKTERT